MRRKALTPHARTPDSAVVMGVPITKPGKALWPDAADDRPVTKLVKSRKQAIAIGLSEARRAGKKVPNQKARK